MTPTLVFLHGLLGSKTDWQKVVEKLPQFSGVNRINCVALDLPFHGDAMDVSVENFEQASQYLADQIKSAVQNQPYFLVGYSLGGRLALYYALQSTCEKGNLKGLILEGANLGLSSEEEKQQRWQNDQHWATRFMTEPLELVLEDWYQQPVFSHLDKSQRASIIAKRANNHGKNIGKNIGKMLLATSLAKQPDFSEKVRSNSLPIYYPIYYIVGEWDQKFTEMAKSHHLNFTQIPQAGHNAHLENPTAFSKRLYDIVFSS